MIWSKKYSSQLVSELFFQHAETVEIQTILQNERSEGEIAQHGTKFVKSVTKEDTVKTFANPFRIQQRFPA